MAVELSINHFLARITSFLGWKESVPVWTPPPAPRLAASVVAHAEERSLAQRFDAALCAHFGIQDPEELADAFKKLDARIREDVSQLEPVRHELLTLLAKHDVSAFVMRPWNMVELEKDYALRTPSRFERAFYEQCATREWAPQIPYRCDDGVDRPTIDYMLSGTSVEAGELLIEKTAREVNNLAPNLLMADHGVTRIGELPGLLASLEGIPLPPDAQAPKGMDKITAFLAKSPPGKPILLLVELFSGLRGKDEEKEGELIDAWHATGLVIGVVPGMKPAVQGMLHINSQVDSFPEPNGYYDALKRTLHNYRIDTGREIEIPLTDMCTDQQLDIRDMNCTLYGLANLQAVAKIAAQSPNMILAEIGLGDTLPCEAYKAIQQEWEECGHGLRNQIVKASGLLPVESSYQEEMQAPVVQLHKTRWETGNLYLAKQIQEVAPKLGAILERRTLSAQQTLIIS